MDSIRYVNILCYVCIALLNDIVHSCDEDNIRDLTDLEMRTPDSQFDYYDSGSSLNDAFLSSGWYRTTYNNWQYTMLDSEPDFEACSTYWPIYLKDKHPPVDTLQENPTTILACVKHYESCSDENTYKLKVRKCNEEVQYYLKTTEWLSSYCFNKSSLLPADVTQAPAPEGVTFGNVTVKPELHFVEEPFQGLILAKPYVEFRCQFDSNEDLFYTVVWDVEGTPISGTIETKGPSKGSNVDELNLHEDSLLKRNIKLGVHIRCTVSASATRNGLQTPAAFSSKYYAGIKILDRTIFLDKQKSATIQMVSTVPMGCQYFKKPDGSVPRFACRLEVKIFVEDNDPFKCDHMKKGVVLNNAEEEQDIANQMCAKYIKSLTKEDEWNPDTPFNFTILTSDHTYEDESKFILKLQFGKVTDALWRDYVFPDITTKINRYNALMGEHVFIQNMTLFENKICKSRNDPHMTTFDGYFYEQQDEGTYTMYIHNENGIEVQQRVKPCYRFATCTCGVAVSAGQDIFMINRCSTKWFLGFTKCGDGGILQVVRDNDYLYKVFTPIGTRVKISLSGSKWMNVDIFMAPKDMGNVEGLCGKADGNKNNDLKHRNSDKVSPLGTFSVWKSIHRDFAASWRVDENSNKNLFSQTFATREKWARTNGLYCMCNSKGRKAEAVCSSTQYLKCTKTSSITKLKCHVEGRRKRNTGNHSDKEVRRLLAFMSQRDGNVGRKKRQERGTVKVTSEATEYCTEKIDGSLALNAYKNISANEDRNTIADWCAFDVSAANDTIWAEIHVEAVNEGVKNMMELQPTYVANHTEEVDVFLKNTCPMNCNSRGNCSDLGVCSCFTYYRGPDCSIDERDGLRIRDIQGGGECDMIDGDECECFYVRSDSIQENFTCEVNTSKILTNGVIEHLFSSTLPGGFEDIFTGICCVPQNIIGSDDVFVARYGVKISNNGLHFGNEENVYVFDSKCQEINESADSGKSFTLKENHCFIEGYCFADNEMSNSGCLACQSLAVLYNWTDYNPCQNGGNCSGEEVGYTCSCVPGYGGRNCEYEINECDSNPCLNGGNCTDNFNEYTCECAAGFTGTNCETDINECESHPCQNGGMCKDLVNMYQCACAGGYDGSNCEFDINECESNPCQNDGSCTDKVNQYSCTCKEEYYGVNCQTKINNCVSNPCQNGASCTDLASGRLCTCLDGFEGPNCEIDINDCLSQPCQNGGSCIDYVDGFNCTCVDGFEGNECDININECLSSPCQNDGTCTDLVNAYTCKCAGGYRGTNCEEEIDECFSQPCQNGGTCKDQVNGYFCECAAGYEGTNCRTDIDECSSQPCQNGGTCKDLVNGYQCECPGGYEGTNCQTEIDECISQPCENNGTCTDKVNGYLCECLAGYEGNNCEDEIDECTSQPCQNGGTCKDLLNGFQCECPAGYEGTSCETETDECISQPCENNGTCTDKINGYLCECLEGYEGNTCEEEIDECSSQPCQNGGTCKDLLNGFQCECPAGYEGTSCETEIDECLSQPCHNNGICTDQENGYLCECVAGYQGTYCETEIDECLSQPCHNNGICTDQENGYLCECVAGYQGTNCEAEIDECTSQPCQNGGTCKDLLNGVQCECPAGYEGTSCETESNECISQPCENNGTCTDKINGYLCECLEGYEGNTCEEEIDECSSQPCQNGGTCKDLLNGFQCECPAGYEGTSCETEIDECLSQPCHNNGICTDQENGYLCECVAGFQGTYCETEIDECLSQPCHNNGICTDQDNGYLCECVAEYQGTYCEAAIDECTSQPCQNGGTCKDLLNGFQCECPAGYEGTSCETESNECISQPCENNGTCTDKINGYLCECLEGYEGNTCEEEIDECSSQPCQNSGTCKDLLNGFQCECPDGYEGTSCETEIDECLSQPCHNNGICTDQENGYLCECVAGYQGTNCEAEVDECISQPCENNGTCTDKVNGYLCECLAGYEGNTCEEEIDECSSQPCQNGGTCKDLLNGFECECSDGYEGTDCQTEIDECISQPCENNGTCTDKVNGYLCECLAGYEGNTCEEEIDECSSQPCQNGGTCKDLLNGFECECVPGYESISCETETNECFSEPCENNGTCKDQVNGYVCECTAGYEGTNCDAEINECFSESCQNNGTCTDLVNSYLCECVAGFVGTNCEEETDECISQPCQNNGTCIDHVNGYSCECMPGYEGSFCEDISKETTTKCAVKSKWTIKQKKKLRKQRRKHLKKIGLEYPLRVQFSPLIDPMCFNMYDAKLKNSSASYILHADNATDLTVEVVLQKIRVGKLFKQGRIKEIHLTSRYHHDILTNETFFTKNFSEADGVGDGVPWELIYSPVASGESVRKIRVKFGAFEIIVKAYNDGYLGVVTETLPRHESLTGNGIIGQIMSKKVQVVKIKQIITNVKNKKGKWKAGRRTIVLKVNGSKYVAVRRKLGKSQGKCWKLKKKEEVMLDMTLARVM